MEFETDGRRESVRRLSRVAATSTRRDVGDRGGRCWRACFSVRLFDGVWHILCTLATQWHSGCYP